MMRLIQQINSTILVFVATCITTGCANMNSIFREYNSSNSANNGKSVLIDVKQRAILSNIKNSNTVICAEPSPDALSVLATGLSGSLDSGAGKALELALSQTENGAFIGNRTVTIQLLRDNLYRACEAYMGGAIKEPEYYQIVRRYQIMTMGLLAIEHLTETKAPPSITINAGSPSASTNKGINKEAILNELITSEAKMLGLTDKIDKAQKALDESIDAEKVEKQKILDKLKEDADKLKAKHKYQFEEYQETKKILNGVNVSITQDDSSKLNTQQNVTPGTQSSSSTTPRDKDSSPNLKEFNVSQAVYEIVKLVITDGFKEEQCVHNIDRCLIEAKEKDLIEKNSQCTDNQNCPEVKEAADQLITQTIKNDKNIKVLVDDLCDDDNCPEPPKISNKALIIVKDVLGTKFSQLRFDIFTDDRNLVSISKIKNGLELLKPKDVRVRKIDSLERCLKYPNIDKGQTHIIKYDANIDAESFNLEKVKKIVGDALSIKQQNVRDRPVSDPTPYYMSIFVCSAIRN